MLMTYYILRTLIVYSCEIIVNKYSYKNKFACKNSYLCILNDCLII